MKSVFPSFKNSLIKYLCLVNQLLSSFHLSVHGFKINNASAVHSERILKHQTVTLYIYSYSDTEKKNSYSDTGNKNRIKKWKSEEKKLKTGEINRLGKRI